MGTDNGAVVFDAATHRVTAIDMSELDFSRERYQVYCEFWIWASKHFNYANDPYFTDLHGKFQEPITTAYNNHVQRGLDFDGLPPHIQYLELVWAFNRGLVTGSITPKQQEVQQVTPPPPVQTVTASSSASHDAGIFDKIPYVDRRAERIQREADEKRAQAERDRVHAACMKTVTQWMQELARGFQRAGKEPRSPSKLFSYMKLPVRSMAWSDGWLVKGNVYVTTSGDFYELKPPRSQYDPPASRRSLSVQQAVELVFGTNHSLFMQKEDGTIMAAPDRDSEGGGYIYTCDVKQFLIRLVGEL